MALDHARVAMSLRDARDVNRVARLEDVAGGNRLPELQLALAALVELARRDSRCDLGLLKMTPGGQRRPRKLALAERHLHGFVAVGRRAFQLRHGTRPEL